jgi:hypothetical protein
VVLLAAPAAAQLVESRHTVLASLAFAVLISEGLRFVASWLRWLAGVAVGILLLANQGLAFRQAEAGRLSARLLSSLTERRDVLGAVSHVVIDIDSLAREIPSGWNPRPTETLRSYWGLHLFAPWGLEAMVQLAGGRGDQLVVCQGGLRREGDSLSCRRAWPPGAHRWTGRAGEVHIVDFETVCGAHGAHCPPHWSGL